MGETKILKRVGDNKFGEIGLRTLGFVTTSWCSTFDTSATHDYDGERLLSATHGIVVSVFVTKR